MENRRSVLETDALPHHLPDNININTCQINTPLKVLFEDFTMEEYKSIFFLLLDYIGFDNFLNVTQNEKPLLFKKLCSVLDGLNKYNILIELFGTMKKYNKLRLLGTCLCDYKKLQEKEFNQVDSVWKILFSLCEELTDEDLKVLKEKMPKNIRDSIVTAEDWFWSALKYERISKTDFSDLENIFHSYPKCLDIIHKYQAKPKLYHVKTPTIDSPCGIALIINYETFDEHSNLPKREGNSCDVNNLKDLWNLFGFKTEVFTDLTESDTFKQLEECAKLDHSNYDLFVCCILSHGKSNAVYSSDGKEIPISNIIAAITNKASTLDHKPKLFFIQACQGTYIPQGCGKPPVNLKTQELNITHNSSEQAIPYAGTDTLRVISSIDGCVSFRNPERGSWFVLALCEAMKENGDKHSMLDVIVEVNNKVRSYSQSDDPLQIPDCFNTFHKTLILKKIV